MTDEELLLRRILERPGDDVLRLVYADRLAEREPVYVSCLGCGGGGAADGPCPCGRANCRAVDPARELRPVLIRKQIELQTLTGADRERAERECAALVAEHDYAWLGTIGGIGWQANSTWVPECDAEWRRGFVESIALPAARFVEFGPRVFAEHPVTRVELPDRKPAYFHDPTSPWGTYGWMEIWWFLRKDVPGPLADAHRLPDEIYDELRDGVRNVFALIGNIKPGDLAYYPSAAAAEADLSAACVRWARRAAGLPAEWRTE